MKRMSGIVGLAAILILGGCLPSFGKKQEELLQENEENVEETVIIPDLQLKDNFYRTLLPFKKSASRGMIVNRIYTKYDMKEAEEGLLRLSTQQFEPKTYFFQEGQYIDEKMAKSWLSRKSKDNEEGLNPAVKDGMSEDEIAADAPIYLAHMIEQNYLVMTDEKKVRLAGISIGLALNSIYYTRTGKETVIPDKTLEQQGMKMAEIIVSRLRAEQGLTDIPIVIGLFKQESRNSIVPGTYFATAVADKGKGPTGWKVVDEHYIVLPTSSMEENYRDINTTFKNFKQDIDEYFPSFVNVIGKAFIKNNRLQSLTIEVPIQFFGTSETIGFTQYITSLVNKHFPDIHTEVSITSVNGPEALIVKEAGNQEPYVHIYGY
ncbi:CamS family sex pheromone protein [Sporosarcina sp. HYO08]|uniref:CamS family sex pheromone protein n=1 Tax=Sporosarcina sp. HYO08 TaxID=1759557 RepID=UPI000799AF8C|nr:CamS family sex pheromone protein [Sporosarcina sp. HYO08]KXH86790.1 hypothetical protein AU377_14240 [Sporosarcina sp. HYO08]